MVERRPPVGGHPPDRPAQRRFLDSVAITSTSTRQGAPPLLGFLFLAIALIQQRPRDARWGQVTEGGDDRAEATPGRVTGPILVAEDDAVVRDGVSTILK